MFRTCYCIVLGRDEKGCKMDVDGCRRLSTVDQLEKGRSTSTSRKRQVKKGRSTSTTRKRQVEKGRSTRKRQYLVVEKGRSAADFVSCTSIIVLLRN